MQSSYYDLLPWLCKCSGLGLKHQASPVPRLAAEISAESSPGSPGQLMKLPNSVYCFARFILNKWEPSFNTDGVTHFGNEIYPLVLYND